MQLCLQFQAPKIHLQRCFNVANIWNIRLWVVLESYNCIQLKPNTNVSTKLCCINDILCPASAFWLRTTQDEQALDAEIHLWISSFVPQFISPSFKGSFNAFSALALFSVLVQGIINSFCRYIFPFLFGILIFHSCSAMGIPYPIFQVSILFLLSSIYSVNFLLSFFNFPYF